MSDDDIISLANGTEVPKVAVDALAAVDVRWPGATLPQARPAIVAAILAALSERCTIATVEQLDALPMGSVIRDRGGRVFEMTDWKCGTTGYHSWWSETGAEGEASSDELDDLSALLIWHPSFAAAEADQ